MNCMYLKIRTKKGIKYGYCSKNKKEVPIFNCKCNLIEYKQQKTLNSNNTRLKNKTSKLANKEAKRFSIVYSNLNVCCVCGNILGIEKNEIYEGAKRIVSINNGFVSPMCDIHHKEFHNNRKFALYFKILFQCQYMLTHSLNEFIGLIHYNYLYELEEKEFMEDMICWLKSQIALIQTREHFDLGLYEAYTNCLNKIYEIEKGL